jgi:hypothetical protein
MLNDACYFRAFCPDFAHQQLSLMSNVQRVFIAVPVHSPKAVVDWTLTSNQQLHLVDI